MKTLKMEIEFTYDDEVMHAPDDEGKQWFIDILQDEDTLQLFHEDIGDFIGDVKIVSMVL